MSNLVKLSDEQKARVNRCLEESRKLLDRELAQEIYNPSNGDYLKGHIERLESMLVNGWHSPSFN